MARVVRICVAVLIFAVVGGACQSHWKTAAPTGDMASATLYVSQADQLYARRDDLKQLQQGIVLLRQATAINPNNYDAQWRLAKFDFYLATHTDGEYSGRAFREGAGAGQVAVKLQPDKPDGHFWLGANYGASLQSDSISGLASVDDVRKEMETVLKLDEGYQDGSAYMVLGLLDLEVPRIVGGDPPQAVAEMEKGLRFGGINAFLRLHLAEAYQAVQRPADAKQQLNTILTMAPDPNYLPELKEAQSKANEMLEKIR